MGATIPRKLALPLLLVGALLCMGAKWAEKPIESLASVAGEWRGKGDAVEGHGAPGTAAGGVTSSDLFSNRMGHTTSAGPGS
jgi:hypothetical protein